MQITKLRPFYEVEISTPYSLRSKKISFQMRRSEDARDGYVELLPDVRFPIENVKKKRIDASVQAAPIRVSNETQTNLTYPTAVATQYELVASNILMSPQTTRKQVDQAAQFSRVDELLEYLIFNEHVNLYKDDYAALKLKERIKIDSSGTMNRFATFSDLKTSRGKPATDVSWCAFISGIIAVCYSDLSRTSTIHSPPRMDEVADAVEGGPPVLIWSYTNDLKAMLYLHAPKQVSYLSWCSFKNGVIAGGLKSGQVVIWDICGKIEDAETLEVYTGCSF